MRVVSWLILSMLLALSACGSGGETLSGPPLPDVNADSTVPPDTRVPDGRPAELDTRRDRDAADAPDAAGDTDAGTDAGTKDADATADAGPDATADAAPDAELDAQPDGTPEVDAEVAGDAVSPGADTDAADAAPPDVLGSPDGLPEATPDAGPPPDLLLPVQALTFVGIAGEWVSDPQDVVPGNAGGGAVQWSVQTETPWLAVLPAEGAEGSGFAVQVLLDQAPAGPGTFQGQVTVTSASDPADVEALAVALETVGGSAGPFTTTIAYDDVDRVTAITFPDQLQVKYEYGLSDQPVEVTWPDGTVLKRQYDDAGRLVLLSSGTQQMSFAWDGYGLPAEVAYPDGKSFAYAYDAAGRLTALTYPDGTAVKYTYDSFGRLAAAQSAGGTTSFAYDDLGRPVLRTSPGGTATAYAYDDHGILVAAETTGPGGNLIVRYEQEFDSRGLRTSVSEITPDGTFAWSFAYDVVGRLAQVDGPDGSSTFAHDLAGRRIEMVSPAGTTEYAYDTDGRMTRAGDVVFRYDPRGRMTERLSPTGKTALAYDPEDHLLSVVSPEQAVQYGYAPDGTRHARVEGAKNETTWQAEMAGVSRVLYREAAEGALLFKTRYVYGPGWLLEERSGMPARILVQDLLGNLARVVAQDGTVEVAARFTPFGERLGDSYVIGYQGQEQDPAIGLVHLRAREYDPQLGIFLSKDTAVPRLTSPAAFDRYRYAAGDPVNYEDSEGREEKSKKPSMEDVIGYIKDAVKKLELADEKNLAVIAIISIDAGGAPGEDLSFSWDFGNGEGNVEGQMDIPFVFVPEGRGITGEATWINGWLVQKFAKGAKTPFTEEWKFSVSDFFPSVKGDIKITVSGKIFNTKELVKPIGWNNKGYLDGGPGPKGGVSLDQAAEVLSDLGDITGAAWDPSAGQLVLYGPGKQVSLPPMAAEDVVAAYRSVFLHPGDAPGVTIGTVEPPPGFAGEQGVGYFAGVEDTHLGWILFAADKVLKSYAMGEDNVTGQPVQSAVPGYESVLEKAVAAAGGPKSLEARFWFVPDKFELALSPEDGNALLFTQASMKVLTEAKFLGELSESPVAAAFAAHFTDNFDLLAQEQPALEEMRRVTRIVSVLQWMKEQGIPLDADWFARFDLPSWETPLHTPTNTVSMLDAGGQTVTITGGVDLGMANTYAESPAAGATAAVALAARPAEETQGWTFAAESVPLAAAALTTAPMPRAGYGYLAQRDAEFPVPGSIPFALLRYCAAFDVRPTAFGYCWDLRPHALRPNGGDKLIAWPGFPAGRQFPDAVTWVDRRGNREVAFQFAAKVGSRLRFVPQAGFGDALHLEEDDTWTLERAGGDVVVFRGDMLLSYEQDLSGNRVTWVYDEQAQVVALQHSCGREIDLAYDNAGRVAAAALPGGTMVSYAYDEEGNLATVAKTGLVPVELAYGQGHEPAGMTGLASGAPAATGYDFLGRVSFVQGADGTEQLVTYEDYGHTVTTVAADGTQSERTYDEQRRLSAAVDPLGRETQFAYSEDDPRPSTVVDPAGRTATYAYDAQGRVVEWQSEDGQVTHVYYDDQARPVGVTRSGLPDLYLDRDDAGRIVKVCDQATLLTDGEKVVGVQTGDSVTKLAYDAAGEVSSVVAPGKLEWTIARNEAGEPVTLLSPAGMEEQRTYDEAGRVTGISRSDGSWVELTYDATGRIDTVVTPDGSYLVEVDALGEVVGITDPTEATTVMERDAAGRLVGIVHPDGGQVELVRDSLGRIVKVVDGAGLVTELTYDAAGRMTTVTTGQTAE